MTCAVDTDKLPVRPNGFALNVRCGLIFLIFPDLQVMSVLLSKADLRAGIPRSALISHEWPCLGSDQSREARTLGP